MKPPDPKCLIPKREESETREFVGVTRDLIRLSLHRHTLDVAAMRYGSFEEMPEPLLKALSMAYHKEAAMRAQLESASTWNQCREILSRHPEPGAG